MENKSAIDMTIGTEWKQILRFSLPIMLGHALQQLYNAVDSIVVGNFAGATKAISERYIAAIGGGVALMFLFLAMAVGLGMGGGIQISQFYGARRYKLLRRTASTQIITMGAVGMVLSAIAFIFARPLLSTVMNYQDPLMLQDAVRYYKVAGLGVVFVYIYNAIASNLNAIGDSKATLYFLAISSVMNIVLDLVFVICFHWDLVGVAVATVISQIASCVAAFIYMIKKYPMLDIRGEDFVFDFERLKTTLRFGVPSIIQQSIISVGNIFMQRLINGFNWTALISGYAVGNRMESFAFVPIFSLASGVSTFTGQNTGADRLDRVYKGRKVATIMVLSLSLIISFSIYLVAPDFARVFGLSSDSLRIAVEYQRFMSFVIIIFALYIPTSATLTGSGDTMTSTLTSITSLFVRVSSAYLLVYVFDYGYKASWLTVPLGWIFGATIAFARFSSGKWKEKSVFKRDAGLLLEFEEV